MKTRSQRKYLDQLPPELVRAVLSCVRPADALPLARCSKHWRDACLSDWELWRLWYVADFGPWRRGISPKHVWRGRYQRAWVLRIEPGKRACGLTLGADFSAYSPRGHPDSGEMSELEEEEEFHRRGRLTVRNMGDERDSDDSSDADDSSDDAIDLKYCLHYDDAEDYDGGAVDPNEINVGVYLSENEDNRIDTVVAYCNHGSLFDPARPWLNRAGLRPGSTLRQMLAAFRLTIDDVECHGNNYTGPICSLDSVDGLRFGLDNEENWEDDDVAESWNDFEILMFFVHDD